MWRPQEDRDAIFRIAPCGDVQNITTLCGWLVGLDYKTSEGPPKDFSGRSECGLKILRDFIVSKDSVDVPLEGKILDPRTGTYYKASIWMNSSNELNLRGYLGISLFGKTVTWSRYKGPDIGANCQMAKGI